MCQSRMEKNVAERDGQPLLKVGLEEQHHGENRKKRVSGLDLEAGGAVVGFKKNMLCMSESSSKPCD